MLLRKNFLSSSGIHVLQCLGLSNSPKTFSHKFKQFKASTTQDMSHSKTNYLHVHWYDNLYRSLNGFSSSRGETSVTFTVHGFTEILDVEPIRVDHNNLPVTPSLSNLFTVSLTNHIQDLIRNHSEVESFSLLENLTYLNIPLKAPNEHPLKKKIIFNAESVLSTDPASTSGTVCILDHLKMAYRGLNSSYYSFLTVDYDIYWRINRMYHTASLPFPRFPACKKSLILILGPWHILSNLLSKIWKFFLPYLFSFLYFSSFKSNKVSTTDTSFSNMLHFIIALYKYKDSLLHKLQFLEHYQEVKILFIWLLRYLIPLVFFSLLLFIITKQN